MERECECCYVQQKKIIIYNLHLYNIWNINCEYIERKKISECIEDVSKWKKKVKWKNAEIDLGWMNKLCHKTAYRSCLPAYVITSSTLLWIFHLNTRQNRIFFRKKSAYTAPRRNGGIYSFLIKGIDFLLISMHKKKFYLLLPTLCYSFFRLYTFVSSILLFAWMMMNGIDCRRQKRTLIIEVLSLKCL